MSNNSSESLRNITQSAMLAGFYKGGDTTHGYAAMQAAQKSLEDAGVGAVMPIPNVYRAIVDLQDEGLIAPSKSNPNTDPRRKPFDLTEEGKQAYAKDRTRFAALYNLRQSEPLGSNTVGAPEEDMLLY